MQVLHLLQFLVSVMLQEDVVQVLLMNNWNSQRHRVCTGPILIAKMWLGFMVKNMIEIRQK